MMSGSPDDQCFEPPFWFETACTWLPRRSRFRKGGSWTKFHSDLWSSPVTPQISTLTPPIPVGLRSRTFAGALQYTTTTSPQGQMASLSAPDES
jgi:hypothetical protein